MMKNLNADIEATFAKYGKSLELKLIRAIEFEVSSLISEQVKDLGLNQKNNWLKIANEKTKIADMKKMLDTIDDKSVQVYYFDKKERFHLAGLKSMIKKTEKKV